MSSIDFKFKNMKLCPSKSNESVYLSEGYTLK